jgi:hypothetical protein
MFHNPYAGSSHRHSILYLPNGLFPSDVPTKTLQTFLFLPVSHDKTISSFLFDYPNDICGAYDHNTTAVIIVRVIIIITTIIIIIIIIIYVIYIRLY